MSIFKKFIVLAFVVISSAEVWGQAASSPFTTYGIGEPYGDALVHNQGMGGLGISHPQVWYLNNQNPALLVYNPLTIFQAGMVGESRTIRSNTFSEKNRSGNLNYLATAFPIKLNKWTSSVGLMPFTNVDFEVQDDDYVRNSNGDIVDTIRVTETGSGGLTQLYWSNGVRLTREISVGLKATYVFGAIDNIYSNQLATTDGYIVNVQEKTSVNDFLFGLGFSYSKDSLGGRNDYRLSVGAVYNFGGDLRARKTDKIYSTTLTGDTVYSQNLERQRGQISLPPSVSAGISLSRGTKWAVGTDFTYQDWSSFKSINADDEGLGKSWRATVGGELTPDAVGSYIERITYRTGVTYEQYPFLANNSEVKDFGINFGLSLPAGRSSLDLAVKVGKRGDRAQNVLEENYFKVYFGITFNDQWFIKRKFD